MEDHKSKVKVLSLIKKCEMQQPTARTARALLVDNIFKHSNLQVVPDLNTQKPYRCVGLTQFKQMLSKSKKVVPKKTKAGLINISLKSYTVRSNEAQDNLMTKQEILCAIQNINFSQKNSIHHRKTNKQPSHYKSQTMQMSNSNKIRYNLKFLKDRKSSQRLSKYQEKVERLQKCSLNQRKENISSSQWPKMLRSSVDNLVELYKKDEEQFQSIKRDGFKIKAFSKQKKELEWIQAQKDSALFQFLQNNKLFESIKLKKIRQSTNQKS